MILPNHIRFIVACWEAQVFRDMIGVMCTYGGGGSGGGGSCHMSWLNMNMNRSLPCDFDWLAPP
jgi:hypothetical protein